MKQSLLEQLQSQSTYLAMQWRNDIFDYFVSSFLIYLNQFSMISSNGQPIDNI